MSLDEFKHARCSTCNHHRRKVVAWSEEYIHRLNEAVTASGIQQAWYCLNCGTQIDRAGKPVPAEDPNFLSKFEKNQL